MYRKAHYSFERIMNVQGLVYHVCLFTRCLFNQSHACLFNLVLSFCMFSKVVFVCTELFICLFIFEGGTVV